MGEVSSLLMLLFYPMHSAVLLRIRSDGLGLESTVVCWLNLSITRGGCELDTRTPLACRLGSPKSLTVGVVIWKAGIELISSLSC